jgi:DNA-binding transcriptional LysR family regulator
MIDIVVPEHPSIVSQKLYDGEFVIVCRKEHPRIQGELTETQFMSEKHAVLDRTRRQVRSLNHFTGIDLSKRKIVFHGRSLFSNILLSSQSDYLTVVPRSMAMQFQQQLDLQIFSPPFEYVTMSHYLIWLRKLDNDPAHRWLRNQIGEWAAIMSKALKESSMIFDRDA